MPTAPVASFDNLVDRAGHAARAARPGTSALVAISGIDASGKGFIATRLAEAIKARGLSAVTIGIDPWLRPPAERESAIDPGGHFYRHAFDFPRLFATLVEPLRLCRSIRLRIDLGGQSGLSQPHEYRVDDADLVILEGVFLLRRDLVWRYDLRVWIECSRETALERAVGRNQEGLSPDDITREYRTRYFPAQDEHDRLDRPRTSADLVMLNDHRLAGGAAAART